MKVALVHDWLTGMRGGEKVLEALLDLHPDAEIFTLLHDPGSVSPRIESRPIHTSFLQGVPGISRRYRYLLPLFPRAVESLDLRGFDAVISSSHCVAKGVSVPDGIPHLCYCHTPMRYVWDQYDAYFGPGRASAPVRVAMRAAAPRLRRWDVATASGVGRFVANSRHVADRIRQLYGRESSVVHPPVDLERFAPAPRRDEFYLLLGSPAPYKRLDLAVRALRRIGRPIVWAGASVGRGGVLPAGAMAGITRLGAVSDDEVASLLAQARALVLPGVEDFGITVVEALASGTPVIALGHGGVLDTIHPLGGDPSRPPTGVFFDEPTEESLMDAVERFETHTFDPSALVEASRAFGPARFREAMEAEQAAAGIAS